MNKVTVGSRWSGVDREFIVTDIQDNDEGQWIFYKNAATGDEFSCLVGAFVQRFRLMLNDKR